MAGSNPNISVRVVCGSEELKVTGSYYLTEDRSTYRLSSTDDLDTTLERFLTLYRGTSTQFSIAPGDPARGAAKWIVTARGGPLKKQTDVKGYSKPADPTYLTTIRREFQEETGSDIPERYFHQDPADPLKFCLNIDRSAKSILDKNYEALKPATEIWGWEWITPLVQVPCPGTLVPSGAITRTPMTNAVVAAKARLVPAVAANAISLGRFVPPEKVFGSSKEDTIAKLEAKIADLKTLGKGTTRWETALSRINSSSDPDAYKTVNLAGGRRRTIRRKKSKQSKRRGTSKKGVRRSH